MSDTGDSGFLFSLKTMCWPGRKEETGIRALFLITTSPSSLRSTWSSPTINKSDCKSSGAHLANKRILSKSKETKGKTTSSPGETRASGITISLLYGTFCSINVGMPEIIATQPTFVNPTKNKCKIIVPMIVRMLEREMGRCIL